MKLIKLILGKIVIVEIMLLIIYFALIIFGLNIPYFNDIITTCLNYLSPLAFICLIPYIVLSILDSDFIKVLLEILGIIAILVYLISYFRR